MLQVDADATLKMWSVDVDIAGHTITIPPLPAADWMVAVCDGSITAVIPGLLDPASELVIMDALDSGDVTAGDLEKATQDAIAAASGMRWWTAVKLAHSIAGTAVGAELLLRGVDAQRVPFAAYLAAGYRAGAVLMEEKDRRSWERELEKPPPDVPLEERFDEVVAANQWMAAMTNA